MTQRNFIKGLHRKNPKSKPITQKQHLSFVDKRNRGLSGWVLKSQINSKYNYRIKINVFNYNFSWLGWANPHKSVWEMLLQYPDEFLEWVYGRFGVDLVQMDYNQFIDFALSTGLITINGKNVPQHALNIAGRILQDFKTLIEQLKGTGIGNPK